MKRILLVDDDPLVLRVYEQALSRKNFKVETAEDGLAAIKALHAFLPDLVVLDLMMPKLSGVEVLRLIRNDPKLAKLPVVVLSNAYMDSAAQDAAALGAQKGLLKTSCTPQLLAAVILEALGGEPAGEEPSHLLAIPKPKASRLGESHPKTTSPPRVGRLPEAAIPAPPRPVSVSPRAGLNHKVRSDFLNNGAVTCSALRQLFRAFVNPSNETEREFSLKDLYRKVHFVAAMAGVAACHQIAHMAAALEVALFVMMNKPTLLTPSLRRTTGMAIDFFEELFKYAREWPPSPALSALALVVDDDPISNRLAVSALRNAHVQAHSSARALDGLRLLEQKRYDLVLLDIEMDDIDGFELSKRLRQLPGYLKTPVIFVTLHSDFETRAKTIESGGDDLIAKPILPAELAVKTVMHLLKTQMLTIPPPESLGHEPSFDTQTLDREVTSQPQSLQANREAAPPSEIGRRPARQPKAEEERRE